MNIKKKYVVYIDESGDPNLFKIDSQFPVFGVGAIIFEEEYFNNVVIQKVKSLKINNGFKEDLILHSSDIRKCKKDFIDLFNVSKRKKFYEDINNLFLELDCIIISSVIDKTKLKSKYNDPGCPYDISFQFILERLEHFLRNKSSIGEIFIEQRGGEEKRLEDVFVRLKNKGNDFVSGKAFSEVFVQDSLHFVKKENIGTQLSDLICYPITTKVLRSDKTNLAYNTLKSKFYGGNYGEIKKYGFKIFP